MSRAWENPDDPAPAPGLADRAFGHVGKKDFIGIDLRKTGELERVFKSLLETADGVGKTVFAFLGQLRYRPARTLLVRLKPDLFQMGREMAFLLIRNLRQDVPYKMHLAVLPA
jgi:hypothetical protein